MSNDIKNYVNLIEKASLTESVKITKGERDLLHSLYQQGFLSGFKGDKLERFKTQVTTWDSKAQFNAAAKLANKGLANAEYDKQETKSDNRGSTAFGRTGNRVIPGGEFVNVSLTSEGLDLARELFGDQP